MVKQYHIVYSGSTQGWIPTSDDDVTDEVPQIYDIDFLVSCWWWFRWC
jgi:hypothetical protein